MNAYFLVPGKRSVTAMAFVLLSGCALQNKTGSVAKPQPVQRAAASPEAAVAAPAGSAAPAQNVAQPAVAPETKLDSETLLSTGMRLYEIGDYNGAIRHLQDATQNWKGSKPDHINAVKYIAFSYCLSSHKTLCRRNFVRALKLDPAFDLDAGEKGHPLWGPEFERAKKSEQARAGTRAPKKK